MIPRLDIRFSKTDRKVYLGKSKLYPKEENVYLVNHARSGILLALQSLELPKGSMVGMMTYNCRSVMDAIAQAGHAITFIDVTEQLQIDLSDLEKKKDHISALVITHLFGIINDMQEIRDLCPEIPIIEDCAHAFSTSFVSTGDFAVYSIGQGKFPSVGDGGIVRVNNHQYLPMFSRLYDNLPEYSKKEDIIQYCSMSVNALLYKSPIFSLIHKYKRKRKKKKSYIIPQKMSSGIQSMLSLVVEEFPVKKKEQVANAEHLKEMFFNTPSLFTNVKELSYGINAFMLVALCKDKEQIKRFFYEKGVEAATHFEQCIEWAKEYGYIEESCPKCEYLIHHLLMIPTYFKIE